jgi:2-keto-4-pentenoate hydratase/2-oxohepta-3-ene-1,7-dioic acid hydratase in catechol pathway
VKLARVQFDGAEMVALVAAEMLTPVALGGSEALLAIASAREAPAPVHAPIPLGAARILSPVGTPPAIRDFMAFEAHIRDASLDKTVDAAWYEEPIFYFTNPGVVSGPEDEIVPPRTTRCLDYELEVACVIGSAVSDLDPGDPSWLDVIAGFTIFNDWSARDIQVSNMRLNLGPCKGKDFANTIGPYLVTPDELPGVASGRPAATMTARVNGAVWSTGELSDIYFSWPELLAFASRDSRLVPGDLLCSGTVGTGCILELRSTRLRSSRPWLTESDVVELEVEGLGVLRNRIGPAPL